MRVILDTNVLMSGIFFGGIPGRILSAWQEGRLSLVVSPEILAEYVRVGNYLAEAHPEININNLLAFIAVHAEICSSPKLPCQVCADEDDDMFLACALASKTGFIISGDKALLAVAEYRGVHVLSPRTFAGKFLK